MRVDANIKKGTKRKNEKAESENSLKKK